MAEFKEQQEKRAIRRLTAIMWLLALIAVMLLGVLLRSIGAI